MSTWDRIWSAEEDRRIAEWRGQGVTMREIASRLPGRSEKAVSQHYHRLVHGQIKGTRQAWTTADSAEVIRLREVEHKRFPEIDTIMGRVRGSSGMHYRAMKQPPQPARATLLQSPVALPAPASLTAWLLGDPLPGRSALDRMRGQSGVVR